MASCLQIAEETDRKITVYWENNNDCRADFTELFQPVNLKWVNVKLFTNRNWYLSFSRKRNLYIPGILRSFIFTSQITGCSECLDTTIYKRIRGKRAYIISGYSLTTHYPLHQLFKPIPELQDIIDRQITGFGESVIGIHIRRGDNQQSIQRNSMEDYIRFIKAELAVRPETRFYLASDSLEIKQDLIGRFPDKILSRKAVLERYSLQGMKDALVDLWCLAATKRIIGSYYSSYSDLAAELGGIDLTIPE